jgi:hypothetical protein
MFFFIIILLRVISSMGRTLTIFASLRETLSQLKVYGVVLSIG